MTRQEAERLIDRALVCAMLVFAAAPLIACACRPDVPFCAVVAAP